MPKYRQLHTKIIDSFDFNEMPTDFHRVTWMLLPLILDSEGRGIYSYDWVKSKMYPLRNDVTNNDIQNAFEWFEAREMLKPYEISGRMYFYVPTFHQYQHGTQKEAESLLPAPPQSHHHSRVTPDQLKSNSRLALELVSVAESASASESESESVFESESAKKDVFSVYEQEIGAITPIIAEKIVEALDEFPPDWFRAAFAEAARNNKRSFSYALAILKRWKIEGFGTSKKPANKGSPEVQRLQTQKEAQRLQDQKDRERTQARLEEERLEHEEYMKYREQHGEQLMAKIAEIRKKRNERSTTAV